MLKNYLILIFFALLLTQYQSIYDHFKPMTSPKHHYPFNTYKNYVCPQYYNPVCGRNGKTYSNFCYLEKALVPFKHKGKCQVLTLPKDCSKLICTKKFEPVCGVNGKTYRNKCDICGKTKIGHFGGCSHICHCNFDKYEPYCGINGVTYLNKCELDCFRVPMKSKGACMKCEIDLSYVPVCGKNGHTYPNEKSAKCDNVEVKHKGRCLPKSHVPKNKDKIHAPVCTVKGTKKNKYIAADNNLKVLYKGDCCPS